MVTVERVVAVIAYQLEDVGTLTAETSFVDDLDVDMSDPTSLDTVEIMMALEEKFGVEIDQSHLAGLVTISDVVTLLNELIA